MITNFKRLMLLSMLMFIPAGMFGLQQTDGDNTTTTQADKLKELSWQLYQVRYQIGELERDIEGLKKYGYQDGSTPVQEDNKKLRQLRGQEKQILEEIDVFKKK